MKCEIIKDLLPAYCDCVCSLETAAEIESHTQNCESCKKLLEDYRSDVEPLNKSEPQKPFRKIKRVILRSKTAVISLIILLVTVLSAVGYLTYGQIVRRADHPSFETIISSQKAKKLVKKFCEGDIDYVMENIEIYQPSGNIFGAGHNNINNYCRNVVSEFYEKNFKGKSFAIKADHHNSYYNVFDTFAGTVPMTMVQIYDGNSEILDIYLFEHAKGKFVISLGYKSTGTPISEADIHAFNFAVFPENVPVLGEIEKASLNNPERNYRLFAAHFGKTDEEIQRLCEKAEELMKEVTCENCHYSDWQFDSENQRFLTDRVCIFSENSSGRRIVHTQTLQIYSFSGFTVLDEYKPDIIDEGVSPVLREKIEKMLYTE